MLNFLSAAKKALAVCSKLCRLLSILFLKCFFKARLFKVALSPLGLHITILFTHLPLNFIHRSFNIQNDLLNKKLTSAEAALHRVIGISTFRYNYIQHFLNYLSPFMVLIAPISSLSPKGKDVTLEFFRRLQRVFALQFFHRDEPQSLIPATLAQRPSVGGEVSHRGKDVTVQFFLRLQR